MTLRISPPRQGRLGSRKSNDGCITCKIRKVKCDELRPICQRCLSTGRKCDGYASRSKAGSRSPSTESAIVRVNSPTTYANLEQAEVQSFEFFIQRVVPGFSRIVDNHFWHQLLPQLSHSDTDIWNAVITLSCLIQYPRYSAKISAYRDKKGPIMDEEHRRALGWYSKSISGLQTRIKQATTLSPTAVISCILYICIESLQDNIVEAIALYERAIAMMGMKTESGRAISPENQSESSLESTLRALLQNMSVSHRLWLKGERTPDLSGTTFQSLTDAREQLFGLIPAASNFVEQVITTRMYNIKDWTPSSELWSQQRHLQTQLQNWHSALDNLMKNPASLSIQNLDNAEESYHLLQVVWEHYNILVSVCFGKTETAFDDFIPNFQNIVHHASHALAARKAEERPVYTFETGFVPSLFFVASKCRHPIIRRQAISLLRRGTKIENTWKADMMAEVAEWTVGVEEGGNIHARFCSEPQRLELPPNENRIYRDPVLEFQESDRGPANFFRFEKWRQTRVTEVYT